MYQGLPNVDMLKICKYAVAVYPSGNNAFS